VAAAREDGMGGYKRCKAYGTLGGLRDPGRHREGAPSLSRGALQNNNRALAASRPEIERRAVTVLRLSLLSCIVMEPEPGSKATKLRPLPATPSRTAGASSAVGP
jgi:hypothetical protein